MHPVHNTHALWVKENLQALYLVKKVFVLTVLQNKRILCIIFLGQQTVNYIILVVIFERLFLILKRAKFNS